MNNFKKLTAIILALCMCGALFTSCNKNENITSESTTVDEIIETITEKETVEIEITDAKGNVSVSVSERIVTIPVTTKETANNTVGKNDAEKNTGNNTAPASMRTVSAVTSEKNESKTTKAIVYSSVTTTKKPVVNDVINENAVGIYLLSKSDPVRIGSSASIIIQGTPGKTYSIEFYKTPETTADIKDVKADSNGFVTWSFKTDNSYNLGKRKVIIKENGSSNYIETSITLN